MIRNRYRILYYIPNLKHMSQYALGALVETEEGLTLVRALKWPGAAAFDFNQSHNTKMEELWARMEQNLPKVIERDWVRFTANLKFGGIRRYPSRFHDPLWWVQWQILPR